MTTFNYQWQQADSDGSNQLDIVGASGVFTANPPTSFSRTLVRDTIGKKYRLKVVDASTGTQYYSAWSTVTTASSGSFGTALDTHLPKMPTSSGAVVSVTAPSSGNLASVLSSPVSGKIYEVSDGGSARTCYMDWTSHHFDPNNPITIRPAPGSIINFSRTVHGWYMADVTGLVIEAENGGGKFNYIGSGNCGFKWDNCQYIEHYGGETLNNGANGCLINGQGSSSPSSWANKLSSYIRIDGLIMHDNGGNNTQSHNMYFGGGSSYSTIQAGADTFLICNCVSYNSSGYCYQIGGMAWNGIVANCVADNYGKAAISPGYGPGLFVMYNESDQPWYTRNILWVNNIASNTPHFAYQGSGHSGAAYADTNIVRDNLPFNATEGDYQDVYGGTPVFTKGTNEPNANPLYVNNAGHDYHLQAGSPAIGVGDVDYMPQFDRDGIERTQVVLGAYAA